MKRAQMSTEYIILLAFILVALVPILYYSLQKSNLDIKINQVDDAVNALAKTADSVYMLGPGTKENIWITLPSGVQDIKISGKEINIKISLLGKLSDVHAGTVGNVTGYIPKEPGTYRVPVQMLSTGFVLIGEGNDTYPPIVLFTSPSGQIPERYPILSATTDEDANCRYDIQDKEYASMLYPFTGNGVIHTDGIGPLNDGDYAYYVRCRDVVGNTMNSSALINFTVNTTGIDQDKPDVFLELPENKTIRNLNFINFVYNVTDNTSGVESCTLRADGILDTGGRYLQMVTDNSIEEIVSQVLGVVLLQGNYSWNLSCIDDSQEENEGVSEDRWLRINKTLGETWITSCAGWCAYYGMDNGVCENTPSKCDNNCGLNNTPSCYAGPEVSENYCLGGPESDTCCCILYT